MLRTTAFLLAALSSSFSTSQVVTHVQAIARSNIAGTCPGAFTAQRVSGPTMMVVDSGTHLPVAQQVTLRLNNADIDKRRNVAKISVTVQGLTGAAYVLPIVAEGFGPATRNIHAELKLAAAPGHWGTASLRVNGITSIRTIELDAITYDDGSQWQGDPHSPCTVEPNGFMLVDAH